MKLSRTSRSVVLLVTMTLPVAGCSSFDASSSKLAHLFDPETQQREEEARREQFQTTRSTADMHWLLRNHVENGMTPSEINRVLGEDGTRVFEDGWIKNHGGHYHAGDNTWKWGPDRAGNSIYLVFRDNKLVNFNPDEFAPSPFAD
ncbi:MAG: hypothetical protein ACYTGL_15205 [Planctomycetota bacterium]